MISQNHLFSRHYLWNTGHQFGDWLALDAEVGSYIGATETALIATAYFAYSTSLVIRSGKVLGEDVRAFESMYEQVKASFQNHFIKDGKLISQTQTAHVLTLFFDLAENPEEIAARLAEMIRQNGCRLQTGFVGTPYLLPALTKSGYAELAYSLLLQEEFPSWLFSVNQGATTIWEHWDGINADGKLWSSDMNSFNHYAYGAVGDWMYEYMAGIRIDEHNPGFKNIIFAAVTDERMDQVEASVETKYGLVTSAWECKDGKTCYRFQVPQDCTADIYIEGEHFKVAAGDHMYER